MGTLDDLKASFGDDVLEPRPGGQPLHTWVEICVCGHPWKFHSPSIGGGYQVKPPYTNRVGGVDYEITTAVDGCVGCPRTKGSDRWVQTGDREARTGTDQIIATCPCPEFRAIARADRPNRMFCQRIPTDRVDPARHPFVVGCKAMNTHLSKRPEATEDPDWATAEFDRRVQWLPDARVCGLSSCKTTDGVWPVFVDGGRSELRCAAHR